MKDILDMTESKPALAKNKKSKYTREQKIAAVEALEIAKRINERLKRVILKNETR
jgi:hypothetical protein